MDCVESYLDVQKKVMDYFGCDGNYYIKIASGYSWRIKDNDGSYFIAYWKEGGKINECVIVRNNGEPMIIKKKKYTMVVCIECVKIALILKNNNNV